MLTSVCKLWQLSAIFLPNFVFMLFCNFPIVYVLSWRKKTICFQDFYRAKTLFKSCLWDAPLHGPHSFRCTCEYFSLYIRLHYTDTHHMDAEHKMHSTQMHSTMMHSTKMHSTQTHITRMHSTWMHHAQSLGCTWARAWMHARSAGDARLRSETEKWSTKIMTSCMDWQMQIQT